MFAGTTAGLAAHGLAVPETLPVADLALREDLAEDAAVARLAQLMAASSLTDMHTVAPPP